MQCVKRNGLLPRLLLCTASASFLFSDAALAASATFRCVLKDVVVYSNRVHCQCKSTTADGSATIRFFAVATSDPVLADRLLSVGTTALVSGRVFIATYNAGDTSGSAWNCGPNDCRRLTSFGIE